MKLSDFDFDLPQGSIALRPQAPRSKARLLYANKKQITDRFIHDLPTLLNPNDRLIFNNTKVIPVHLDGIRKRQGHNETKITISVLLIKAIENQLWLAMAKPIKRLAINDSIEFAAGISACVRDIDKQYITLDFGQSTNGQSTVTTVINTYGNMPLPPYITKLRATDAKDRIDYQSIFAEKKGSIAAPTASLHFDHTLLHKIQKRGVDCSTITLHVGVGTFLPVQTNTVAKHKMHSEWGEITPQTAQDINATRARGGRIIAVGTTVLRTLETAAAANGTITAWRGETDLFIYPPYQCKITNALITNFHLPKSTLIMLVAGFVGLDPMQNIYRHALANGYRFLSYGDACFLCP